MNEFPISKILRRLRKAVKAWKTPVVTQIGWKGDPFLVLISCLISLRTRDEVTGAASLRLFQLANTPEAMQKLKPEQIEQAIYPAAFFRNKTQAILAICQDIVEVHEGKVPDALEALLKLKGVGRKTANLTLTLGFGKPGICVDIHVHRITNRWGYISTKTPDESELVLRKILPKRYWIEINDLLVTFGQNRCKPQSPYCSECEVKNYCQKMGVMRSR